MQFFPLRSILDAKTLFAYKISDDHWNLPVLLNFLGTLSNPSPAKICPLWVLVLPFFPVHRGY